MLPAGFWGAGPAYYCVLGPVKVVVFAGQSAVRASLPPPHHAESPGAVRGVARSPRIDPGRPSTELAGTLNPRGPMAMCPINDWQALLAGNDDH